MSNTPWNSIAESIISLEERPLTYKEGVTSPCATCATSPCCTYLPLNKFNITNMVELDHALYLLNFDRIELGLSASGEWSAYYRYPCRFLNRTDFTCTIHNTPEQPQICVHYNPYQCWYKRVLTKSVSEDFIRVDRQRMEYIVSHLQFDETRKLSYIPEWEDLLEGIANLPLEKQPPANEPPTSDPVAEEWKEIVFNPGAYIAKPQPRRTYEQLRDPCSGCQAYCCKTLVFPQSKPGNIGNLDYFKFCLGFPGIELAIADDIWSIVVKTTCRHLDGNRCSIYGQPERPLICKYYDAHKCTYKPNFGTPRPEGFLRIKLDEFNAMTECFEFDEFGNIAEFPPVEAIRTYIEQGWLASAEPAVVTGGE